MPLPKVSKETIDALRASVREHIKEDYNYKLACFDDISVENPNISEYIANTYMLMGEMFGVAAGYTASIGMLMLYQMLKSQGEADEFNKAWGENE